MGIPMGHASGLRWTNARVVSVSGVHAHAGAFSVLAAATHSVLVSLMRTPGAVVIAVDPTTTTTDRDRDRGAAGPVDHPTIARQSVGLWARMRMD